MLLVSKHVKIDEAESFVGRTVRLAFNAPIRSGGTAKAGTTGTVIGWRKSAGDLAYLLIGTNKGEILVGNLAALVFDPAA